MATIIFIADGWGSKYGGINSFNYDLCMNLSLSLDNTENTVICITTGEVLTQETIKQAEENKLILINLSKEDFNNEMFIQKTQDFCTGSSIWWIGHDIKTGFYAIECAKLTNSKSAIIHHMNYDAYYTFMSNNPKKTDEKNKQQVKLLTQADVIFAVGPKLTDSANKILIENYSSKRAIEIMPGIADIKPVEDSLTSFSAITFGRISIDNKDIIKQTKLTVAGFATAVKHVSTILESLDEMSLTLIGLDEKDIESSNLSLRDFAYNIADRQINLKGYPYTDNRNDLFQKLRSSSVCMMLSIHEGFGLVGWEAISAGVPIVISKNSGLYSFLLNQSHDLEVESIDIKGDLNKGENSQDIQNVSKVLKKIMQSTTYKARALALRKRLISEGFTWDNTALKFADGLGIESQSDSDNKKNIEKINNIFLSTISLPFFSNKSALSEIKNEFKKAKKYDEVYDAHKDIAQDINTSAFIKVKGVHCSTFCPENNNPITKELLRKDSNFKIRILTANPFSDYVIKRLLSIKEYKNSEQELKTHHINLYETARMFKKRSDKFITRFYDSEPHFRLYFTQKHLYLSIYAKGLHARFSRVFCFNNTDLTYKAFDNYFNKIWSASSDMLPQKAEQVSSDKRYIFGEEWPVKPSLVINVCSKCNMKCLYCPTGGENLCKISDEQYCDYKSLSNLIKLFPKCGGNNVVRITGGEPLLNPEIRERTINIIDLATKSKFSKIILCTNAVYLKTSYEENKIIWEKAKNFLLLKISFDTMNEDYFHFLTGCATDTLKTIKNNIAYMSNNGFKIELNIVAKKQNVNEISDIFSFAKKLNLVGIKILTVNDFGNRIEIDEDEQKYVEQQLKLISKQMQSEGLEEKDVSLHDGVGIRMKRFIFTDDEHQCTLTIVDHNQGNESITPKRTFCKFCEKCKYYPCATGIMNLTLRADGMLGQCRLKTDNLFRIGNRTKPNLEKQIKKMLEPFSECFLYKEE